jgi:hypothetical protein
VIGPLQFSLVDLKDGAAGRSVNFANEGRGDLFFLPDLD